MIGRAEDGTLAAIAVAEEDERELEVRAFAGAVCECMASGAA